MHLALPVIFRILYCCGLRVSEVCNLQFRNVNLDAGLLTIRDPKNDCDRYIPFSDSVKEAWIAYAEHIWLEQVSPMAERGMAQDFMTSVTRMSSP